MKFNKILISIIVLLLGILASIFYYGITFLSDLSKSINF